jgi:hypothetical protein
MPMNCVTGLISVDFAQVPVRKARDLAFYRLILVRLSQPKRSQQSPLRRTPKIDGQASGIRRMGAGRDLATDVGRPRPRQANELPWLILDQAMTRSLAPRAGRWRKSSTIDAGA